MTAALADTRTADAGRRQITVRPAPPREPPFDDEIPPRHLHLVGPHDQLLPFAPSPRRLTNPRDIFAVQPTGRGQLPDPRWFGRRLFIAALEAIAGRRSPQQLASHLSPAVLTGLVADHDRR